MTVTIKGHTYEMGRKKYNQTIKEINKMMPKAPTILSIEKNGHAEMRRDVYENQHDLTNAICLWNKRGYKVQFTRGL